MLLHDLEDGSSVFVDANIFIYHFSQKSKFNADSTNFLERIEKGKITGITSTSVVQEVTHRMMIIEAAAALQAKDLKDLVKHLKAHPDIVQQLEGHRTVPEKICAFNLDILSPDIRTIERSQEMKSRYGFLSNDALSLQIMKDVNVTNLASNDSDFERVDFIKLYKPSEAI